MDECRLRRPGDAAYVTVFSNVVLPPVASANNHFQFNVGAFTADGQPLPEFRLRRGGGTTTSEPDFPGSCKTIDLPATYGGMIDFHFGHFMLETLSRLWYLRRAGSGPIIWHRQIPDDLKPWQTEIFGLCGIDVSRFVYVSEPLMVKEMAVPEPGLVLDVSYHPIWADALGVFPFQTPAAGKRVWMSRSKLPANFGHVEQELEIEDALARGGWKIIHPHLMPNTELLYFVADAAVISGFAASAYFILLLSRNCQAKIRMVDRGGMGIPPIFEFYARAKDLQQQIMRPGLRHVSGVGAKATFTLESVSEVVSFVND